MAWKYILIAILLLIPIAEGRSDTIMNATRCYGNMTVYVVHNTNSTFILENCSPTIQYYWTCPCQKKSNTNLIMVSSNDTTDTFTFLVDYYIDKPKTYSGNSTIEKNNIMIYNDNIKRTYGAVIGIYPPKYKPSTSISLNIISLIIGLTSVVFVVAIVIFGILWKIKNKEEI